MPVPFELGRTRLDLASLAHAQGRQQSLNSHLTEAHRLFAKLLAPKYVERTLQLARKYEISLVANGS
jgi:hypothetical protein